MFCVRVWRKINKFIINFCRSESNYITHHYKAYQYCKLIIKILSDIKIYYLYDGNPLLRKSSIYHYSDVIMGTMASQITSLTIVYLTVYSCRDQGKHQSSASLAFVREINRWPVNSPHKWPVTRKMFPFDDVIVYCDGALFTPPWAPLTNMNSLKSQ